jgi:glycine betaine/proline transport system permease protein
MGKGHDHRLSVRHFVVLACLIGIPIGMYAATSNRLWAWVQAAIDTLQTLPSFVYLMPAVMLFRVGDFTAMIAVVAFAVRRPSATPPSASGGRSESDRGRAAMGCTEWQILTKIRLKLALPEILLGSTRPSCLPCRCWSSPRWSAPGIWGRRSISR